MKKDRTIEKLGQQVVEFKMKEMLHLEGTLKKMMSGTDSELKKTYFGEWVTHWKECKGVKMQEEA